MSGTVKQLKDALETMRKIYQYDEEKTCFDMESNIYRAFNTVAVIRTKDEETGVEIKMSKELIEA